MSRHTWTEQDDAFLRKNWKEKTDLQMAFHLGLRIEQVSTRRRTLGLRRNGYLRGMPEPEDTGKYFNPRRYRCWLTGEKP